jgi:hypothetical protein
MKRVLVRYRVKPEHAARNEELVRAVYDELARTKPDGLRYQTLLLEDGVTFVHLAVHAEDDNPLSRVEAFKRFTQDIGARCDEVPVVSTARVVGTFE